MALAEFLRASFAFGSYCLRVVGTGDGWVVHTMGDDSTCVG